MRQHIILAAAISAAVAGLGQTSARANVTWTATNAIGATVAPFELVNPGAPTAHSDQLVLGDETITFSPNTTSPYSGIYLGDMKDVAVSPFDPTRLTATSYLAAQNNDPVTITFATAQTTFGLLWGSIDSYTSIIVEETCAGATSVCAASRSVINGADVARLGGSSAFVTIADTAAFDKLTFTSSLPAFEFVPQAVPEPVTLSILGVGLFGLGAVRRRRQSTPR